MKNLVRILSPMLIKLRAAHKWKFTYHIQNPEKKVKEFEKPKFACVFALEI